MKNQGEKCWIEDFWKWVVPSVDMLFPHTLSCGDRVAEREGGRVGQCEAMPPDCALGTLGVCTNVRA